ncbi:MAG: hypothetical protein OXB88_04445 [Bacteriovoracales bacterium]|nr:hypothetical protein [Bacteriovoracales bacterium]
MKKLEIFCGTGGVGKSTLAASRALFLARQRRVLLITVDPSKRLKEILSIDEDQKGSPKAVSFSPGDEDIQLHVLLMCPEATLQRVFMEKLSSSQITNNILKILAGPFGGLHEILALLELQHHLGSHSYDTIVLDTPPGHHFVDFLSGGERVHRFFNQNFQEVFQYLDATLGTKSKASSAGFIRLALQSGIKKLLVYLERMTGRFFVEDFVDAIRTIYSLKDLFLKAAGLPSQIMTENLADWFLVTSVEHDKLTDARHLQQELGAFNKTPPRLLINRCTSQYIKGWHPHETDLIALKNSLISREKIILGRAKELFPNYSQFEDINSQSPRKHLEKLLEAWENQCAVEEGKMAPL